MTEKSVLGTKEFWSAAAERAIKTFAQGLLAVYATSAATPLDINWKEALITALFAASASLLVSVVSAGVGNSGPSLTSEELVSTGKHAAPDPAVGVVPPNSPPTV